MKLLEKDPAQRIGSAMRWRSRCVLESTQRRQAASASTRRKQVLGVSPARKSPGPLGGAGQWSKSRKLVLLAVALLLLLGAGGYGAFSDRRHSR